MKVFWGVIAAAAAITALIMAGTGMLMKDLDERHGNKKKTPTETTYMIYNYSASTESTVPTVETGK